MNRNIVLAAVLALSAVAASAQTPFVPGASAQAPKTRAQVVAELQQAQRNGDLLAPGELGVPERVIFPNLYRHAPTQAAQAAGTQAVQQQGLSSR